MDVGDTRQTSVPYIWTGKEYSLGLQDNNEEVELIAIRYALQYLEQRMWRTHGFFGDVAVIHSDCQPALAAITQSRTNNPDYGAEVQRVLNIKHRIESGALARTVIFRWVPRASTAGIVEADAMARSAARASAEQAVGWVWDRGTPDDYPAYRWNP